MVDSNDNYSTEETEEEDAVEFDHHTVQITYTSGVRSITQPDLDKRIDEILTTTRTQIKDVFNNSRCGEREDMGLLVALADPASKWNTCLLTLELTNDVPTRAQQLAPPIRDPLIEYNDNWIDPILSERASSINDTIVLTCGHRFLKNTLRQYLSVHSEDRADDVCLCPIPDCGCVVGRKVWMTELGDNQLRERYEERLRKFFVKHNSRFIYCGEIGCTNVLELGESCSPTSEYTCSCSPHLRKCFNCQDEYHIPVPCDVLKEWRQKCSDDAANAKWLTALTKPCPGPRCAVPIEKNEGCMHMTCLKCKHQFCWICKSPWAGHTRETCNEKEVKGYNSDQMRDMALDQHRFTRHFERYIDHALAQGKPIDNLIKSSERMIDIHRKVNPNEDASFLLKAIEKVEECRRMLKYTYVFIYFVPELKDHNLLKAQQGMLESLTDKLHEMVEKLPSFFQTELGQQPPTPTTPGTSSSPSASPQPHSPQRDSPVLSSPSRSPHALIREASPQFTQFKDTLLRLVAQVDGAFNNIIRDMIGDGNWARIVQQTSELLRQEGRVGESGE
eukprot:GHVN01021215.1.p1 GENE.GHVN01021215.1~~GHVN01021215.1.p1  ORF type:complete len:560 (+),score=88.36 GHVN01021215.1:64-1743(+)